MGVQTPLHSENGWRTHTITGRLKLFSLDMIGEALPPLKFEVSTVCCQGSKIRVMLYGFQYQNPLDHTIPYQPLVLITSPEHQLFLAS